MPATKVNRITIKCDNAQLDTLYQRAKTMEMPLRTYLRYRGLQPIGKLKQKLDRQKLDIEGYQKLARIQAELQRQGNNLNQIATRLNAMPDNPVTAQLQAELAAIATANANIAIEIAQLSPSKRP